MTETDRTVQVPLSLIERTAGLFADLGKRDWEQRFRALLSQPTPTAEAPVAASELPRLRYSAQQHAGRLRLRVLELSGSSHRDAALMTEAADQLEYLGRAELDNHHAADMCPYCTPDPAERRRDRVDVDAFMHDLFPERDRG